MTKPLVSIVTVFYNRAAEVEKSVGSLLAQTYAPLEIIVVDDGSTDGTVEALRAIEDPRLVLRLQQNQGFTRAVDEAVRGARGEFVAIHGAGDISLPRRVAVQAEVLRTHEEVSVVGCYIDNEGGSNRAPVAEEPRALTYVELVRRYPMTHGEAMFRRSTFEAAGGYRAFFKFGQDHDLWLRMDRMGKFWIAPELLYVRRRFDNAVKADPVKVMQQAILGDVAEWAARNVGADGRDPIDRRESPKSVGYRKSPRLSKKLTSMGLEALLNGDEAAGRTILAATGAPAFSPRGLGERFLCWISCVATGPWRAAIKPIVRQALAAARRR